MIISYSWNHKMNIHKIRNTYTIGIWFKIKLPIPLRCEIWCARWTKTIWPDSCEPKALSKVFGAQDKNRWKLCPDAKYMFLCRTSERHNSLQRLFFVIFSFTTIVDYKIETKLGIWEYLFFSFVYLLHQSITLNALHTHTFTHWMACDRKSVKYCSVWVRL